MVTVLAALLAAILWGLLTWWLGLPSSSSHALIGGIVGSSVAATGGFSVVQWHGMVEKVPWRAMSIEDTSG